MFPSRARLRGRADLGDGRGAPGAVLRERRGRCGRWLGAARPAVLHDRRIPGDAGSDAPERSPAHAARCVRPPAADRAPLAVEFFARAAHQQHGLHYTIVRPFNCVGIGEARALGDQEILSGNVRLAMSHVVPDLVQKVLKGQDPLHILGDGSQVRHYTYGGDLARGIVMAMESPAALDNDFNLSTSTSTTVLELAELIWHRIKGRDVPFRYVSDPPFEHDVQRRVPATEKAKRVLGFEATTT
ncbi:MAG: NAD(P)-dependent oxidoreductase, partial [Chloroflexi bacterium]